MELQGQPGAPQLDPHAPEPKKKEGSPTPKKATTAQLQDSIADLVGAQGGSHCMIRINRLFTSTPCVEATNRKHIHISVFDLPPDHVSLISYFISKERYKCNVLAHSHGDFRQGS
jgi:hypothetical protein